MAILDNRERVLLRGAKWDFVIIENFLKRKDLKDIMKRIYTFTMMDYEQLSMEIEKIDRKMEDLKSQKRLLRKLQAAEQAKLSEPQNTNQRSQEQWK